MLVLQYLRRVSLSWISKKIQELLLMWAMWPTGLLFKKKILQLLCTVYWKIFDSPLFSRLYRKIKRKSKIIVLNSPYFTVTGLGIGVGCRVEILRLPDKPTCIHSLYPLVIVLEKRATYTTCKSFKMLDKIHDNDLLHTTWLESKTCYGQPRFKGIL